MHVPTFNFDEDGVRTFSRVYGASSTAPDVDRIEHAARVTEIVTQAKANTKVPPYCRANVTPRTQSGYLPCMRLLPCPDHGDNPSYHEPEREE
jgi:hypothetical protein